MPSAKQWWKRAAAAVKDKRSIYLAMLPLPRRAGHRSPDMEAAVIRATSHDERSVDYKNAARVFQWARTSPSFVPPLMWALARRATRTRSWPVALKSLLLVHGLLLLDPSRCGRLPFDVSEFRDRSSDSWGFSAFVRAYFQFLDHRTVLLSGGGECGLERIERLQALLDLLMQIRPYAGGMEAGLILEAMDCVLIEVFDVYSSICSGIAAYLVGVLGSDPSSQSKKGGEEEEEWKKKGPKGIGVLRKAADQSKKLSDYFEMCRELGVLNAMELPPVEGIPEEDIMDLERMLDGGVAVSTQNLEEEEEKCPVVVVDGSDTVVTKEWVVFEDEFAEAKRGKPLLLLEHLPAVGGVEQWSGNLIEL
ncbi:putative clathrin assembly protein [Iris pallida]|uniref:Clathrin assembly protein n=1 Tax=Iris pallida TaxID=29817 RepID=A0AAX6DXN9_IRIPA|nr:putative clathrin assembly protein [Iris pallida]